jgi:pyrimidine operon attenuation protein / uracil phosphoribosyltransferase
MNTQANMNATTLADAATIQAMIRQLAIDIRNRANEAPLLIGVRTNGVPIAERIAAELGSDQPVDAIDITLYRDDLASRALPEVLGSELHEDINGRRVVLVDDVLFTGRTVRAALSVLAEYGRPSRIELCALVDRGLRELPIAADHVGMFIETTPRQHVRVNLAATGAQQDEVILTEDPE